MPIETIRITEYALRRMTRATPASASRIFKNAIQSGAQLLNVDTWDNFTFALDAENSILAEINPANPEVQPEVQPETRPIHRDGRTAEHAHKRIDALGKRVTELERVKNGGGNVPYWLTLTDRNGNVLVRVEAPARPDFDHVEAALRLAVEGLEGV